MNSAFLLTALFDVLLLLCETEASPRSKWKAYSKNRRWNNRRYERSDGCMSGVCVQSWKCPHDAIFEEPTGSCAYRYNGPWVCCIIAYDTNGHNSDNTDNQAVGSFTNRPIYTTPNFPPKWTTKSWRQTPNTITEKWHDDGDSRTTPCVEDPWNKNMRQRPTPISALGKLPSYSPDRSQTHYPANKPTTLKPDIWKKSTEQQHSNKRTSPLPFSPKVTSAWNKPSTSYTQKVFTTRTAMWTQKSTVRPSITTYSWKKTTKNLDNKPTNKPLSTYFTSVTKRQTSTTMRPQFHTSKTTYRSTRKSDLSTKSYTNSLSSKATKDQSLGKSTSAFPVRRLSTEKPRTASTRIRPTKRTTKRSLITTPLPDVNIYLCGIRSQSTSNRRNRRSYNSGYIQNFERLNRGLKAREPLQRIVGGEEVMPYSWPWVAALYKISDSGGNRFLSAGSLINENFILTAAHVFTPDDLRRSSYVVMLGTHDAKDAFAVYEVSYVLQHPDYKQRYYYHDIALLKLSRPVVFNDYVMPVCLPSPFAPLLTDQELEGKEVTVMGWGDDSFGGKSSKVLKQATFPIVSRNFCNSSYIRVASNGFPRGITDSMLCAGDPDGGKDACQGDSGGPLTSVENGRYTQVGIVSFGYRCGDKEYPGVYTKVAPYLSWIANNTQYANDYNYNDYY